MPSLQYYSISALLSSSQWEKMVSYILAKNTQDKPINPKEDYQARVHSDQMVLMVVRQEGWTS